MFKIPIDIYEGRTCSVKKGSLLAELFKKVSLIIWDEVPMQDRFCQEAVDLTFKDIRNDDRPFGGVTVVFGGDFQQTLPVVRKGGHEQIVGQCIQHSYLWKDITVIKLTKNMRLNSTAAEEEFAKYLIEVGHGQHTEADGMIRLPQAMKCGDTDDFLINALYPHIGIIDSADNNDQYFLEQTILTSRNDDVTELNHKILQKLPGQEIIFHSADSVVTEEGVDGDFQYPLEYLNSIEMGGLPLAKLRLKVGAPVMILRNLDQSQGLCNGT